MAKFKVRGTGVWDGLKFLWTEMNRESNKPSLSRISQDFPLFNFRKFFQKILKIILPK